MNLYILFSIRRIVLAGIFMTTSAFAEVDISFVTIANPGNTADSTGYGAVSYEYRISKNETTMAQYCEFLNAVAKTGAYGLYSGNMATDTYVKGIQRQGTSGNYTYSLIGDGQRPVNFISWFDAARFCNWMHNGQGQGDTESGAYTLNGATSGIVIVNPDAMFWIPSENEWYKAAYYDPTKNAGAGGYWLFPNQRDVMGGNTPGQAGGANYVEKLNDMNSFLTPVGAYGANSDSFYQTNDQAGNVWEWNDAVVGTARGLRGGSWLTFGDQLASSLRNPDVSANVGRDTGFRVASKVLFKLSLATISNGVIAGSGNYAADATAIVSATPSPGYVFGEWTGDGSGTTNPVAIVMNGDKTVGATFLPDPADPDDDGLSNYQEIVERGTNPNLPDTDGDKAKDSEDAFPLNPGEWLDTDHDGTGDNADTDDDGDGYSDADEINIHHTNPKRADSDGDGLSDPAEIQNHHTDPNLADTDNDGLSDGAEINTQGTLPLNPDTDGDGFLDGYEVQTGKSPLDILDKPALVAEAVTAIEFTFPSALGRTYRIESSTDLSVWTTVESGVPGNGAVIQRFYSIRNIPKRYFRVEEDTP